MKAAPAAASCDVCEPPVAGRAAEARTADGAYIHWREHVIDDRSRGAAGLAGSDGLAMADLGGDGFDDIVSVHESDIEYDGRPVGQVRVAWGSADPGRWELGTLAAGPEAAAAEDVTLADFDADGDVDVLVACELAHLVYFDNPGARKATAAEWRRVILPATRGRGSYIRAFAADFDADGRPEVAAANKGEQIPDGATDARNEVSVYLPPSDPLKGDRWREQVLGSLRIPINAEPVDLDGDGDLDAVGTRGNSEPYDGVIWLEQVRSPQAGPIFMQARAVDSQQMPPPEPQE